MSQKEINSILQKQLATITNVLPKEKEDAVSVDDNSIEYEQIDIYYAVKPFYLILSLIGMQKVTFSNEKKIVSKNIKVYATAIALAVLCVACFIIYKRFLNTYPNMSPASVITDLLTIVPMTFSTIVSLLMAVTCNRGMILRTLNNFIIVDKQLTVQGTNIYKPLRTKILVVMFLVIVGTTLQYVYDYFFAKFDVDYGAKVFMVIVKELVILEIVLLIYVDATRLDIMNVQLENTKYDISKLFNDEVSVKSKKMESIVMKFSTKVGAINYPKTEAQDEEKIDDLIKLMRVYDRLADNANIVNSCFGIPVNSFMYLIIYNIFQYSLDNIFQLLCSAIAVFINILSTVDKLITMSNKPDSGNVRFRFRFIIFLYIYKIDCY